MTATTSQSSNKIPRSRGAFPRWFACGGRTVLRPAAGIFPKTVLFTALFSYGVAFLSSAAFGQTNEFYRAGELDFSGGPSFFIPASNIRAKEFGYFIETTYWQTWYTGTSLEVGNYDFGSGMSSVMGYTAAKQKFRLVPFAGHPFWGRWELEAMTGAVTWTDDGSKGISIGGETQFALSRLSGLFVTGEQQFDTNSKKDGADIKGGLRLSF
ncbi:MAG TPA: hypothetical protein VGY56_10605 [Verrucomicrobiae bacterium]|nr:hypothetical protein [Verrucomicrobiae bacterium]